MKGPTAHSNPTGTMSTAYLAMPRDLTGLSRRRLRSLLGIASKQLAQVQSVGWPALEASWQADVNRITAALALAS